MRIKITEGTVLTDSQLCEAGELLYLTDSEIYPTAFACAKNMGTVFPALAKMKNGQKNRNFTDSGPNDPLFFGSSDG